MALRCIEGNAAGCPNVPDAVFEAEIPHFIRSFEARILREKFGATLDGWRRNDNYHAYFNWSALGSGLSQEAVRDEYRHWPAPTAAGRRSQPVQTGDRSFAFGTTRPLSLPIVRIPLPGGYVEHVVDSESGAIANVTLSGQHLLHPGYIIRWVGFLAGVALSNTLGRGIGQNPSLNEVYGVQLFGDLDRRIKASLAALRNGR